MRAWVVLALGLPLGACSVLAPSDTELLGGSSGDASASGGSAGSASGGSAGTGVGGGGTAGSSGVGGAAGGSGGGASGGGGTGALGGSAGTGATGGSAGGTGGISGGAGSAGTGATGGGGTGGASNCVPGTAPGVTRPVALYLFVDRTNSMFNDNIQDAEQGVSQFMSLPSSVGVELALQFAPPQTGTPDCNGAAYDTPKVPMGVLPGHSAAIVAGFQGVASQSPLSLQGLMNGGIKFSKAYAANKKQTSVVLITDYGGSSDPCGSGQAVPSSIGAAALASDPYVMTWFLPMSGQTASFVSAVASASGTGPVSVSNTESEIRLALQKASARCQIVAPQNSSGGAYSLVQKSGANNKTLQQVSGLGACTGDDEWFLRQDTLVLCPAACRVTTHNASYDVTVTCN